MNLKKVLISAVLSALLVYCVVGACAAADIVPNTSWYTNHESPYTINTAEELEGLASIVNGTAEGIKADTFKGKTILLGSDIVMNTPEMIKENSSNLKKWVSGGNLYEGTMFSGTLDGQNHTITGLFSTTNGLFGYVDHATIKNLTITDSLMKTSSITPGFIGGMVIDNVTIENCHVKNSTIDSVSTTTGDVGAIAGEIVSGKVIGCTVSNTNVICNNCDNTGGIVGYIDSVTEFNNCAVSDSIIIGAKSGSGGIAGYAFTDVSFNNCNVKSCFIQSKFDNYVGGIVGYGGAEVDISECSVDNCDIVGYKHSVGGIVGYSYHTNFANSPSSVTDTAVVSEAEEYVGGFIGSTNRDANIRVDGCIIDNCYIAGCLGAITPNIGPVIGKGSVAEGSSTVMVTRTIVSNKNYPKQSKIETFNLGGVANSSGVIVSQNSQETVNGATFGITPKNFTIPDFPSNMTTKESPYTESPKTATSSPLPILGILAGFGAVTLLIMKRH